MASHRLEKRPWRAPVVHEDKADKVKVSRGVPQKNVGKVKSFECREWKFNTPEIGEEKVRKYSVVREVHHFAPGRTRSPLGP
ncbi:hypothetical protein RUM44_003516 [Polyplax serrata]|uniref:Uncharacterized protein n=1 Tax=Polyplax serrata TaxID=468196 RepID=A0ABR1AI41_POLSC